MRDLSNKARKDVSDALLRVVVLADTANKGSHIAIEAAAELLQKAAIHIGATHPEWRKSGATLLKQALERDRITYAACVALAVAHCMADAMRQEKPPRINTREDAMRLFHLITGKTINPKTLEITDAPQAN